MRLIMGLERCDEGEIVYQAMSSIRPPPGRTCRCTSETWGWCSSPTRPGRT
jgi:hypothetical protein